MKKPAVTLGRPPAPEDERRTSVIRARVTEVEEATFKSLGGAKWIRPLLNRAAAKAQAAKAAGAKRR